MRWNVDSLVDSCGMFNTFCQSGIVIVCTLMALVEFRPMPVRRRDMLYEGESMSE